MTRIQPLQFLSLTQRCITLAFLLLVAVACESTTADGEGEDVTEDAEGADPVEYPCEMGLLDSDGTFEPLSSTVEAELILGFQGFLWFDIHVRATGDAPQAAKAVIGIEIDGEDPFNLVQPGVGYTSSDGAALQSDSIHVFVTGNNPTGLAGQVLKLAIRMDSAETVCVASAEITVVDNDDCIHTNDEPCEGSDIVFDD